MKSAELRVGFFVVVGLAILTYFLVRIGEWPFFGDQRNTYNVEALFTNVSGLTNGASVVLSGVKIGAVTDISLDGNKALVRMAIRDDVDFPVNSVARLTSVGLLGNAIVEIIPREGEDARTAREAGHIGSLNPVTLDQLVAVLSNIGDDVTDVTRSIRDFLGVEGGKERIQQTMQNLLEFSDQLDQIVKENRDQVDRSVDALENLSTTMRDKLPTVIEDMQSLSADLKELIELRKSDVNESLINARSVTEKLDKAADTLQSILDKIDKGDGTVSKLLNNPEIADKTQEVVEKAETLITDIESFLSKPSRLSLGYGFRAQYYSRSDDFKFFYRLSLNFSKRDSFIFELINDQTRNKPPVLQPDEMPDSGVFDIGDEFTITATYGRRFSGGMLRFGLIENSTGLAVDLGADADRLSFSIEGFDFGRDEGPHLRVASHLRVWQGLFFTIGYDDPVDTDRGQIFYGTGYRF